MCVAKLRSSVWPCRAAVWGVLALGFGRDFWRLISYGSGRSARIQSAAAGEDSSALNSKIEQLQAQLAAVSSARAALQSQLAEATTLNAELQSQLAKIHEGDITPDIAIWDSEFHRWRYFKRNKGGSREIPISKVRASHLVGVVPYR